MMEVINYGGTGHWEGFATSEWQDFADLNGVLDLSGYEAKVIVSYRFNWIGDPGWVLTRLMINGSEDIHGKKARANSRECIPVSCLWIGELKSGNHSLTVQYRRGGTGKDFLMENDPSMPYEGANHYRALQVLVLEKIPI